jgi:hypothetical protein
MEDEAHLLQRASQCRRLAGGITNPNDPAIARLLEMAEELEAQAAALKSERKSQTG